MITVLRNGWLIDQSNNNRFQQTNLGNPDCCWISGWIDQSAIDSGTGAGG